MSNEIILIVSALTNTIVIFAAARVGKEWLYGTIIANLVLIGIFGAKLISIFGFTTNAGNVFYACVFLATHFLIEKHGKEEGFRIIWFGVVLVSFFVLMSQLAVQYFGLPASDDANNASASLFSFSWRIFFASILAYVFAQHINISVYQWLRKRSERHVWLRSNIANFFGQSVDSALFFTIAFINLPGTLLVQTILIGLLIKMFVVAVGTPLLHLDRYFSKKI